MFRGTLIFTSFALKKNVGLKTTHLSRFACIMLVFLILFSSWITSARVNAPGLDFFTKVAWLNFWLCTLAGIGFFSTAITEEKEEGTLPLLKMAGINPLGLLLGKSSVRALQIILLLLAQLPFLMLAMPLGGVTALQIIATLIALIAYVILLANFALLCSVYTHHSGTAIALVVAGLFYFFYSASVFTDISKNLQARGLLSSTGFISGSLEAYHNFLQEISIVERIHTILTTGFSESVFSIQVLSNIILGLLFFLTAWTIFERCTTPPLAKRSPKKLRETSKKLNKSRPGLMAFYWKEFHFGTGGTKTQIIKSVFYLCVIPLILGGGVLLDHYFNGGFAITFSWDQLFNASLLTLLAGFIIESTIYTSRLFSDERELRMLPLIRLLPLSFMRIVYEKITGCLLALAPVSLLILLLSCYSPDRVTQLVDLQFHSLSFLLGIQFILFLHLLAYYSLVVRWGALAFAIGTILLLDLCAIPFLQVAFLVFHVSLGEASLVLPVFYFSLFSCFILQILIGNRFQKIAAEEC